MNAIGRTSCLLALFAVIAGSSGAQVPPSMPSNKPGKTQLIAAKHAVPKPTLSGPEPTITDVRDETLSRITALESGVNKGNTNSSVQRALAALKSRQLDWPPPTQPAPLNAAQNLATIMGVSDKTQGILPQLAALNDALTGSLTAQRSAAQLLYAAADQPIPDDSTLKDMLAKAVEAHGAAAPASQHGQIAAGSSTIDIDSSPDLGMANVSVFQTGSDGSPERVTFSGEDKTSVNSVGDDIQTQMQPQPPQVVSSKQSDQMRSAVNGAWTDQDGNRWDVSGSGDSIIFSETRTDSHVMSYVGKWKLGIPYASHLVNDVDDMDDVLPADVKQQLADTYHPPFAVQLTYVPDSDTFKGVWISGQVTYSGMDHSVKVVNDPTWDKPLTLTRKSDLKIAQGGRHPEEGP